MKNVLCLLLIIFFSCNKGIIEDENTKTKITFNIQMQSEIVNFRTKSLLTESIKSLKYYAKRDGKYVSNISQLNIDANFGIITDELLPGINTICFVGHNSVDNSLNEETNELSFSKVSDTFYFSKDINIQESEDNTCQIILERAIGKLEVIGSDAIPSNAKKIIFSLTNHSSELNLLTGNAGINKMTTTREWEYSSVNIGKENMSYSIYSFIPENAITSDLTITSYDLSNEIINKIIITDIQLFKNRIIRYTGQLFKSNIYDLNVSINTTWDNTVNKEF